MVQYRIEWKCLSTNYKGNGQWAMVCFQRNVR